MKPVFTICTLLMLPVLIKAQTRWDSVKITSEKLTNNIYVLKGSGGNIGLLTGPDGIIMIDDQFRPLSEKIQSAIAALDGGTIKFTINTHIHGDHTGGNEFFKQLGATLIAHDIVRERMMKEKTDETTHETAPARNKDAWPVITFSDQLNIHYNGQDIELLHFEPGHTDGDVIIHFKQANVFHMGDVFITYGYPFIDTSNGGNINGLIETLDSVLPLMDDESIIIPGHGNVSKKEDVKKYRDRLADIRDKVAAALKKGTKIEELAGLGITDPYDAEWGKGFIKGKDFVMIVAAGLKDALEK
jgi:glyoxylase-like metal-dependent hydrolase (beta-lactamase superfamily II)